MVYQEELKIELLKKNRREKKKKIPIKRENRLECQLYADPHCRGFSGATYDAQIEGDWVLYRGLHLKAHYRGKKFPGATWVALIHYGIRIYNQRISSRGFNVHSVNIDGVDRELKDGRNNLKRGGFINVQGNKITYSTNDGEEVDFISYGSYYNAFVRSNVPNVSGLCSKQFVRSTFFGVTMGGRIDYSKKLVCPRRNEFAQYCRRRGLRGNKLKGCIFDRCQGMSRKAEKKNG